MMPRSMPADTARRLVALPYIAARDTAQKRSRGGAAPPPPADGSMAAAARWLCRTHDVTGRRGSAQGYSLLKGWAPAFPETTGYIVGTLINYGAITGDPSYLVRAREMADWEIEIQAPDGGIMQGVVGGGGPTITFNTGMVLHGFVDLHAANGEERYLEAGRRAGRFLVDTLDEDGAWRGEHTYLGLPHTYKSRVAWAMIRLSQASGDPSFREGAERHLDWVIAQQRDNGWFENCNFKPGGLPNTHGIAYTLRGLLESHALTGEARYLEAVVRTSEKLIGELDARGFLPAVYDADWHPAAAYECLTGTVQLGNVWMRLFEVTGEQRYLDAGVRAVDLAAVRQERSRWPNLDGALAGSFPIYGRYSPLRYPNWVTKFLLDALIRRREHTGTPAS
jgi:uncharacterized protein YyaL (SSP411 family)